MNEHLKPCKFDNDRPFYQKRMSASIYKPKYVSMNHYRHNIVTKCRHRIRKLYDGGMCRACFYASKRSKINTKITSTLARQQEISTLSL